MSFKDLKINNFYRSHNSDIARDFLTPVMMKSVNYRRAVGFFSSSSLIRTSYGMSMIAKNGGNIKLIVSPRLSKEDVEAIEYGYSTREEAIERALLKEFDMVFDINQLNRLNLLSHLISSNVLDIKVAVTLNTNSIGMYHEKIGYLEDSEENKVAFMGSLNESNNSFSDNFESIVVFKSWESEERTEELISFFDQLWDKPEEVTNIKIYNFPSAVKNKIIKYKKNDFLLEEEFFFEEEFHLKEDSEITSNNDNKEVGLHDYQIEAIESWIDNNARGIFDMATGTGKTYTAFGAIKKLLEAMENRLAVVMICPLQHLVEQWEEEAEKFGIFPITGFSSSNQKDWFTKLENCVIDYNDGIIDQFYFFTTNSTFKSKKVQKILSRLNDNSLFIADEAHNIGASELSKSLLDNFKFRLALSATVDRHRDVEGTSVIYDYFGKKCIEYDLERAIKEKKLTPYKYYPIIVNLNPDELAKYLELTREIGRNMISNNGTTKLNKYGEFKAIERARLIAGAENKISELKQYMSGYINKYNILVYCGTAMMNTIDDDKEEIKQINYVCDVLGNELGMRIDKYTSQESVAERKTIKQRFEKGDNIQALVAIKCLDEGVNIPSIKTAFILASSTNPREYIQRRGRVLRLFDGKDFAEIFDFITLPVHIDSENIDLEIVKSSKSLLLNEINRVSTFAKSSLNPTNSEFVIEKIRDKFKLDEFDVVYYEEKNGED
ncbi:MAG: DEAD/DEAH box helicase family protein [Firmicutes bacterium]|nr:DEAD/DEAH box helicase family protein [Bacillota bacterium]